MVNIRMPKELKASGEEVLHANGISATEAIKLFYEQLGRTQEIPKWIMSADDNELEKKRKLLRKLAGGAPLDDKTKLDDLRKERLSKKVITQ
jgi:antitoxin component of RelBE/YafQ-DinJ toxin-antitoxin module